MTKKEMVELVAEMGRLWPSAERWPTEAAKRVFDELRGFDAGLVFGALFTFMNAEAAFPPAPAQLIAKTREKARVESLYHQALTEDTSPLSLAPTDGWLDKWYPGEDVDWAEHVRRTHSKLNPAGCGGRFCDLCNDEPALLT